MDEGEMDGFVKESEKAMAARRNRNACSAAHDTEAEAKPECVDVMGYHDAREIPNYWPYAQNYVLQDSMFEPNASWSCAGTPLHGLGMVGALQLSPIRSSCVNRAAKPATLGRGGGQPRLCLDRFTYLLHENHISWAYYIAQGTSPTARTIRCECAPRAPGPGRARHLESAAVDFRRQARR